MVTIDLVCCVSHNSIMIHYRMNGKVNFRGKTVYDMVSGLLFKIGMFFLHLTEGILFHIQFLDFVTSKCPTLLDYVALPPPLANPLTSYEGTFIFSKILHLLQ